MLYWGLGYAINPMIAIYFAAEAERKGVDIDFPFLLAVTTAAQALWQYGLSSSAPLLVASQGHFLQSTIGIVPLSTTIWSPAAIIHELTFSCRRDPGRVLDDAEDRPADFQPSRVAAPFPRAIAPSEKQEPAIGFAQRLERSPLVPLALAIMLAGWLYEHFVVKRLSHDINSLNTTLLVLALLLHRTVRRFAAALGTGRRPELGRSSCCITCMPALRD